MFDRRRATAPTGVAARSQWLLSIGLLLEVMACSIALVGLISGRDWWLALVGTALLLLAVPAVLRGVGVAPWLASLIDVAVFAVLIELLYGLGSAPELFRRAMTAIQVQHTPAEPLRELIFFIVLFGGAMAILLDLLAAVLRVPAVTAVVLGGVLVVPALLQMNGLNLVALGTAAVAWLVLLAADGRVRFGSRGGGVVALSVGASATVIALVVAATAPGFVEQGRLPEAGPVSLGNSIDPLIDLGADLRRPSPVDVLRYSTAAKTPQYLQLTTLDDIHGTDWTHTPTDLEPLRDGASLGGAPGLDSAVGVAAKSVKTSVDVQSLRSNWLPAPYPTTKVSGSGIVHSYQTGDLTIFAPDGSLSGQKYTTTSLDLEPTRAQLAAMGPYDSSQFTSVENDLDLPDVIPGIITDTANEIADEAGGSSELDVAIAIQDYFQDTAQGFVYSTDSPDTVDGASLDVVAKFLAVRQGYCVHFASAMAVIARVLGIPSRIAIGYLPGEAIGTHGKQTTYQVDSSDLHAWPQLYFPNVGWLNFEPTVSRGSTPSYTQAIAPTTSPTDEADPGALPSSAPTPTQSARAESPAAQAAPGSTPVADRGGLRAQLGVLALLIVLALPGLARLGRRRGRIRRLRGGASPELAWSELRDTAQDLGLAVSATETPRAFAARLRSDWHPDAAHQRDLDDILASVELAEFGPPRRALRTEELAGKTLRVTAAMRASRHWTTRLLAAVAPRSLFNALGARERAAMRTSTYDRRL